MIIKNVLVTGIEKKALGKLNEFKHRNWKNHYQIVICTLIIV